MKSQLQHQGMTWGRVRPLFYAIVATALALTLVVSATASPASAGEAPNLIAPDGTTAVWVDIEAEAARTAVSTVELHRSGEPWSASAVTTSPFGATAIAATQPGEHDLRVRAANAFEADLTVSFVDGGGTVLRSISLRGKTITPGADGTADWQTIAATSAPSGSDSVTPAGNKGGRLERTGVDMPIFVLAAAACMLLLGAGAFVLTRRRPAGAAGARDLSPELSPGQAASAQADAPQAPGAHGKGAGR